VPGSQQLCAFWGIANAVQRGQDHHRLERGELVRAAGVLHARYAGQMAADPERRCGANCFVIAADFLDVERRSRPSPAGPTTLIDVTGSRS
jgi:hypothetical protein